MPEITLNLYHFFPDKLNLYGDRGNIISLKKRCEWRGITLNVIEVEKTDFINMMDMDLFFIGGGSDREQKLATAELMKIRKDLRDRIENDVPGLTICGGYQFLGEEYTDINGDKLETLEILKFKTESRNPRLIGDVLLESDKFGEIVGFENHGGRTFHSYDPLGVVKRGNGNNEQKNDEGIFYRNLIGTYLHGPILPKNPNIADFLIEKALLNKYGLKDVQGWMVNLNDELEEKAKQSIINKIK